MSKKITFGTIKSQGVRYGWYGRGGAGKTTAALNRALKGTKGKVAVLDAENSLAPLLKTLTAQGFDMERVVTIPAESIEEFMEVLREGDFTGVTALVVDSMTTLDGWYTAYICKHFKPDPKSGGMLFSEEGFTPPMRSREAFGFGKDNTAAYEANDKILAELDKLVAQGIDIHLIMHDCETVIEDARGTTKETQPRLQMPNSGKNSIRHRVKEWLDNLGYVFRSRETDENNRVVAVGGRAVAFSEVGTGVPGMDGTFWAKGRTISGVHQISELTAKTAETKEEK